MIDESFITNGSEEDIKEAIISPAIREKGWKPLINYSMEHPFTDGRVVVFGKHAVRTSQKYADYYLFDGAKSKPLTIIEAKKAAKSLTKGIQQAIEYAEILDLPICYASNGTGFREFDRITGVERTIELSEFPTPEELKHRIIIEKGLNPQQQAIVNQPFYYSPTTHEPRYYQRIAIDRTLDAIARGEQRVLLVMATGTGKTFTAFQILYRLRESGILPKKKILYLADRNILIDQTMTQDFKPFQKVMTKVQGKTFDSAYEIHMALYQQLVTSEEGKEDAYKELDPGFFDLIIVDECHRGSAKENSAWRKVLTYFSSAIQVGLTATPKQTAEADNFDYFGAPVYTYSLKQGIEDGFLAPYKVTKYFLNVDKTGYTPNVKDIIQKGTEEIKDFYSRHDFGREITLLKRQEIVAKEISKKLKEIGRMTKTIIFCPDVEEAALMRDLLVQLNADMMKKDSRYVMRITGEDYEAKKQLDHFIDPDSLYPTIVTTSELLSTGVDCKTCGLIVIDKEIESMTMFKQIIGRGTRLYPEKNKLFFEILDFRGVTKLFSDPEFDGDPEPGDDEGGEGGNGGGQGGNGGGGQGGEGGEGGSGGGGGEGPRPKRKKTIFKGHQIVLDQATVHVLGLDGKELETTDVFDFTRKNIKQKYASLHDFLHTWSSTDRHQAIMDELKDYSVIIDAVREANPALKNSDVFDIICHVAFDQKPLTRAERAANVKKRNYFAKYEGKAREVLEALLDKYADLGVLNLENPKILSLDPFSKFGTPVKILSFFGGKQGYQKAIVELEQALYTDAI